jgi:hypothetical protein
MQSRGSAAAGGGTTSAGAPITQTWYGTKGGGASTIEGGAALGTAAGMAAGLGAAAIAVFEYTKGQFLQRAAELEGYSPHIAAATANASVRNINQDLREAEQLGPAMAKLVEAQSKTDQQLNEIFLPIKKVMVEIVAGVMEYISTVLKEINVAIQQGFEVLANIPSLLEALLPWGPDMGPILTRITNALDQIRKDIEDRANQDPMDDFVNQFFNIGKPGGGPAAAANGNPNDVGGAAAVAARIALARNLGFNF